ncbi:hypothetical protein [Deinococcus navajonensis]|uniref:Uncharacterized protein n=1 Tax=Deinococcus navajonensis TaxID=309884 RepID=A0ABV8XRE7_9DEIO
MIPMATRTADFGTPDAEAVLHPFDVLCERARRLAEALGTAARAHPGSGLNDLLRAVVDAAPELELLPLPLLAQELQMTLCGAGLREAGMMGRRMRSSLDRQPRIRRLAPQVCGVAWGRR